MHGDMYVLSTPKKAYLVCRPVATAQQCVDSLSVSAVFLFSDCEKELRQIQPYLLCDGYGCLSSTPRSLSRPFSPCASCYPMTLPSAQGRPA